MVQYLQRQLSSLNHKKLIAVTIIIFIGFYNSAFGSIEIQSEKIPDSLVYFDPELDGQYAIVVEKNSQQLFLYEYSGSFKKVFSTKCSTGEMPGAKVQSGDKKTPEGVYFFTKEYEKRYLSDVYGTKAFPMDYPNFLDRVEGRNGNSIWMHGTNKPLKARSSNGCVALENEDIDKLAEYVSLNRTPIIVVKKIDYSTTDTSEIKDSILNLLSTLYGSIENGSYKNYLNYFDDDYLPEISWWSEWNKIRGSFHKKNLPISVKIKNISILKHEDIFVVLFDQFFQSGKIEKPIGRKKLYLAKKRGDYQIIGEEFQLLPKTFGKDVSKNPLVYSALIIKESLYAESDISDLVDGWISAWSSGDLMQYGEYYAKDFRFKGMNLKAWLRYKKHIKKNNEKIQISADNVVIERRNNLSDVTFVQKYISDNHNDVGVKHLRLKKEGNRWKIYRETWKKL